KFIQAAVVATLFLVNGNILAQQNGWTNLENVFGRKGMVQGNVFKITFPRSDLKVKVGNFPVSPGLALTSWIGFMKMGTQTMMMGDLVMLDGEVSSVISKLISEGLSISALHNHLVNETPVVKYMHFSGKGDAVKLAEKIRSVLAITGTPLIPLQPQTQNENPDWSKVEAILGTSGKHNGNLLQYGFPRKEKLMEGGMEMPAFMGMATGINFQMDGDRAAITGDFVLLADEVNPVVKALTENGIAVTAIHNHMLYDNPRLFMLHFWAVDNPEKLAKGLKEALDKTNSQK
ncbi:MAG TPA: DUF1259 domain-containing protein, partial [Chitinophagaceae bacterium]|nr:DUF1259 domain-containing protein [Chitinophagaceae bacterium]